MHWCLPFALCIVRFATLLTMRYRPRDFKLAKPLPYGKRAKRTLTRKRAAEGTAPKYPARTTRRKGYNKKPLPCIQFWRKGRRSDPLILYTRERPTTKSPSASRLAKEHRYNCARALRDWSSPRWQPRHVNCACVDPFLGFAVVHVGHLCAGASRDAVYSCPRQQCESQ